MERHEHPILFSGDMVRAILEGRKTQTRRVVKPQPCEMNVWHGAIYDGEIDLKKTPCMEPKKCPYGVPGDRLWVRETWADTNGESGPMISYRAGGDRFLIEESYPVEYSKYPGCTFSMWCGDLRRGAPYHAWRPSIFMPRWASRITLEITGVRVERVQDISEEDAKAEGIEWTDEGPLHAHITFLEKGVMTPVGSRDCNISRNFVTSKEAFSCLWDFLSNPGEKWEDNPWVWVIEFRMVEP